MFKLTFAAMAMVASLLISSLSATAQQPAPAPAPAASSAPVPSLTPAPSESPLATPTPTPTPTPAVTATPAPAPLPTPLVLPPDAPPQILAVQLSDPVFHSGEFVSGTVITSTNVAAVEIRVMGQIWRLPRTDFGVFQMSYTMPRVPFWLRKSYNAQIVAMNSAGVETEHDLTISVR